MEGVGPALLKGLVAANVLQTLNFQQQGVDFVTFLQKGPRKNESRIIWEFEKKVEFCFLVESKLHSGFTAYDFKLQ